MIRHLVESVYVAGRFYAAGDVPDEDHAQLITNPNVWSGDETSQDSPPSTPATVALTATPDNDPDDDTDPAEILPGDLFDPSADGNGLDEVNNHLANADEDEVRRVLAREADGKKRKGILEGPYAPDED